MKNFAFIGLGSNIAGSESTPIDQLIAALTKINFSRDISIISVSSLYKSKPIGLKNQPDFDEAKLDYFMDGIEMLRKKGIWTKDDIVKLYFGILPEFAHKETGKYLDQRM